MTKYPAKSTTVYQARKKRWKRKWTSTASIKKKGYNFHLAEHFAKAKDILLRYNSSSETDKSIVKKRDEILGLIFLMLRRGSY